MKQAKGWHSRGYLPHFDSPGVIQMFTLRQADSMPASKIADWKALLQNNDDAELADRVERYLNAGHGSCVLRDATAAKIVEDALLHFDSERYRLLAWVVMPNHIHVLVEIFEGYPQASLMHSWKSFTTRQIQKNCAWNGQLWQEDVFDRYVRSENHLQHCVTYIHENPVAAGLVARSEDWLFSSARRFYFLGG